VWQCDAVGIYSDVRDSRFDARGKKFLRGYQQTDGGGRARFLTIYPGWYEGRAVHIHFKIRTAAHAFTSQIYFDEAVNEKIMRQAPYSKKPGRRVLNDADFLFRRGGKDLLVSPTKIAGGYATSFAIGLQLS
jgi:protocatechuate 3,4-dioxygenase beta subunit